jgi:hypothetical protein
VPPVSAVTQFATSGIGGFIGGVLGFFAFAAWSAPQPTECTGRIGPGDCMQDVLLGLTEGWIVVLFGTIGLIAGLAYQAYQAERS